MAVRPSRRNRRDELLPAPRSFVTPVIVVGVLACLLVCGSAPAQVRTARLRGTVTTSDGSERVPGVLVVVTSQATGEVAAEVLSDELGTFEIDGLPAGTYRVTGSLAGFEPVELTGARLDPGETVEVQLDLQMATVREEVDVIGRPDEAAESATTGTVVAATLVDLAPLSGDNFHALLPVLPGVIRGPDGRLSLKGGRPDQSGLQVAELSVTDPVTGNDAIDLPIDAVDSVEVIASPYLAEYGRFASGVTRIETRRSANDWHFSMGNLMPVPRFRNGTTRGLSSFGPRLIFGGAVIEDRLFLTQSAQYETRKIKVPGLPDGENDRELERLNTFTRIDVHPGGAHHVVATAAVFPREQRFLTLDTFNREPVSPDLRERGYQIDLADNAVFGAGVLLESRLSYRRYDVEVQPRNRETMTVSPAGHRGSFFVEQQRRSHSYQWVEALTRSVSGRTGEHRLKTGLDVLHSRYSGWTDSRTVDIERADGTLSERIAFPGLSKQDASSTELALFVQDRWRPGNRLLLELGLRLDRDGVLKDVNLSPRGGAAIGVWPDGRGIVRGGGGLFYQRTPLSAAAFESFEHRMVTRYDAAGVSLTDLPETWTYRSDADRAPHAIVWSLEYDQQLAGAWLAKVGHLRRHGRNELIVEPAAGPGGRTLRLHTGGRSRYRETEITLGYTARPEAELFVSYVNSRSEGDFNAYDRFFGNLPHPIIRTNAYAPAGIDVPHRVIVRGLIPLQDDAWHIAPVVELRNGFPFSLVDERQEYVGPRNAGGRFPIVATLDLAVSRVVTIKGRRLRLGVRTFHLLQRYAPRDVQNNMDAPDFGAFYNGIERRFSVTLQVLP